MEKAVIARKIAEAGFVRDQFVRPPRSESTVWFWDLSTGFNDRFRDLDHVPVKNLLQMRSNAASANGDVSETSRSSLTQLKSVESPE